MNRLCCRGQERASGISDVQDVARVDHAMAPRELVRLGSDTESLVLARAVRRHVEHRILLNGHRTVVFR